MLTLLFVSLFFLVGFMRFVCLLISLGRSLLSALGTMGLLFLIGFVCLVCLLVTFGRSLLSALGTMGLLFLIGFVCLRPRLMSRCLVLLLVSRLGARRLLRLYMFSSITAHQFKEAALLAARGRVLVEESEMLFVELREEFIPGNLFEGPLPTVARKVNT